MTDYIKREDAYYTLTDYYNHRTAIQHTSLMEALNHVPSADVAPVRHGRWVDSTIPNEQYVCSECGGAAWYYDYNGDVAKSKYCPNCGAKMDEESNE